MFELMTRFYVAMTLPRDDRGDVPGWVLITVMTAGLVAVIYGIAREELRDLLRSALNKVS
ncbi:MAG: hypothetical protein WBQ50_00335 [Nocardioides sp.]